MNTLTVLAKIRPGQEDPLRRLLEGIGNDIKGNPYVRFTESTKTHFARWAIINDEDNGPRLLFACNYDGDLETYVTELVRVMPGIDQIWGRCKGYRGRDDFLRFIRKHSYVAQSAYVGFPGETVSSIRNYIAIRQQIEQFLDLGDVAQYLERPGIAPFLDMLSKVPKSRSPQSLRSRLTAALGSLAHSVFLATVLWVAKTYAEFGQSKELTLVSGDCEDQHTSQRQVEHAVDTVTLDEGLVQNQMTTLTTIKPGRLPILRFALAFSNLLYKWGYPPGEFANVGTLHSFAFVLIDNGKRMLFLSNYDGSWQNYMSDFINKLVWALDAIYKDTYDYPKAGMKDVVEFMQYILDHQVPPQVFYSAYPDETVMNLIQDRQLSSALGEHFDRKAVEQWLGLL